MYTRSYKRSQVLLTLVSISYREVGLNLTMLQYLHFCFRSSRSQLFLHHSKAYPIFCLTTWSTTIAIFGHTATKRWGCHVLLMKHCIFIGNVKKISKVTYYTIIPKKGLRNIHEGHLHQKIWCMLTRIESKANILRIPKMVGLWSCGFYGSCGEATYISSPTRFSAINHYVSGCNISHLMLNGQAETASAFSRIPCFNCWYLTFDLYWHQIL